tara:strand:- start:434 stop:1171 length:738 start_codon:yes stop_codon:yes gene_type:complete
MHLLNTKTIYLSNYYPENDSELIKNVAIESGTKVTFDLSNIVNENSNNLGVYKTKFNFGDGVEKNYNSTLFFDGVKNTFKFPQTVEHDYFISSLVSPSTGQAKFFYKNGKTFNILLSVFFTLDNNIDRELITGFNNGFVALSADSLLGLVDNDNNFYNEIIQNSSIEELTLSIPTVGRSLSAFTFVTSTDTPYAGSTARIPFSATDPGNITSLLYAGFTMQVTRLVEFLLNPDGSITNITIIRSL